MDLSIVIPAHDEEGNVVPLYLELTEVLKSLSRNEGSTDDTSASSDILKKIDSYEIIYIDDGSEDDTYQKLKDLHQKDPSVKVIKFRKNFGQSSALQAGFDYATGDFVVAMDADLQNDPEDIPRLFNELENNDLDLVSGWRKDRNDSPSKRFFSWIADKIQRPFLGKQVHDYGCTLKVYRQECLKDLQLYGEMHRYIPPLLRWRGYRVGEIEVNHRSRHDGETHYGLQRLIKGGLDMLNVWFWQKFSQRPLHIFGGLGILSATIGLLGGLYSIFLKIFRNVSLSDTALPLFAVFMVLIGIQFFISGLLADISIKNYYLSRGKDIYNIDEVLE